jgi:plasmid stabilization system protein ParE
MRLVYSVEAVADLIRLRAFITTHDPSAAARIADELVTRIALVRRFPELGKSVPLAPDPEIVRDAIFGKYVVRYTTHPTSIVVLRIWHQLEDRTPGI